MRTARRTLVLPAYAVASIVRLGWNKWPQETGGVLLGKPAAQGALVTHIIGPGPQATHGRYNFTPDSEWQAAQVATRWGEDNSIEYLGDWHTHPHGTTRFSSLDREAAEAIANFSPARQPQPYMLVFALRRDAQAHAAAARLVNSRLRAVSLLVTPDNHEPRQ